jgi:hypothetical protein
LQQTHFTPTVHFLSRERKRTKRKRQCPAALRAPLRVVAAGGARGNSSAFAKATTDSDRSACLIPHAPSMLGAGQKGFKPKSQNRSSNSLQEFGEVLSPGG